MKYQDNITTLLVRFEDGDEICYQMDWANGIAVMLGAVGIVYIEEMERAL